MAQVKRADFASSGRREKIAGFAGRTPCVSTSGWSTQHPQRHPMEAERINTIRSQLNDLTTRVVELRRYL